MFFLLLFLFFFWIVSFFFDVFIFFLLHTALFVCVLLQVMFCLDGLVFFREHRIRFQQELARKTRGLPKAMDNRLDLFCEKLGSLLDLNDEKPALLHGDLWSGNYFASHDQIPYIFDPAVYFGLRETDLAMTEMFGRLPQEFYSTYQEVFPTQPGYTERKDIYNLYHLLNHYNLFGGSYLEQADQTVRSFLD